MGQSERTVYVFVCNPYSWYVLLSLLMSCHPPGQATRDCLFISPENRTSDFCPGSRRGHISKSSSSHS